MLFYQVHFGALKDHREVAIKVQICKRDKMVQDVYNMLKTTYILKAIVIPTHTREACFAVLFSKVPRHVIASFEDCLSTAAPVCFAHPSGR